MPNNFLPIGQDTDMQNLIRAVNGNFAKIDNESVTKTFKQAGGNAIINGKLPYSGGYGSLYYDQNNIPSIVVGILPDGSMGIVVAKPGVSVLDLF